MWWIGDKVGVKGVQVGIYAGEGRGLSGKNS